MRVLLTFAVAARPQMWLRTDSGECGIRAFFGEQPSGPGIADPQVEGDDKTVVVLHNETAGAELVSMTTVEQGTELCAPLDARPMFSLELATTYTVVGSTLFQFWATASVASQPRDWFTIQEWTNNAFEISIRDPWMKRNTSSVETFASRVHSLGVPSDAAVTSDTCREHGGAMQDGAACVVAVVRFNKELVTWQDLNITFYVGGRNYSTVAQGGTGILKVPLDASLRAEVYATVDWHEPQFTMNGTFDDKTYSVIHHFATTFARIARDPEVVVV
jgi:hypothetical protein